MNYGLLEELGALFQKKPPFIWYEPDGTWREHLPKYENQTTRLGQETSGCTVWGWQNALEIFEKGVYRKEPNYSERFTYILAGITPQTGRDPAITVKTIQEHGLIDNDLLPMTESIEEFMDSNEITGSLRAKGQNWLLKNELVVTELWNSRNRPANYIQILKENLKRCPVPVSVSAWNTIDGVYVSDKGSVNNHFCVCFEVIDYNGLKDCPVIFDSYDHTIKVLHPEHNIRRAFAFWLNKKKLNAQKSHILTLLDLIKTLTGMQTLTSVINRNLNTDPTPGDETPDEVACVDVATTILRVVYPSVPKMVSTVKMEEWLSKSKEWHLVSEPHPEAIIISPTEGTRIGHVGFCMEDGTIASNNSFGVNAGKLTKNYTYETWLKRYKEKLGLKVKIYKKVI